MCLLSKFRENPLLIVWVILLTNTQTDKQTTVEAELLPKVADVTNDWTHVQYLHDKTLEAALWG